MFKTIINKFERYVIDYTIKHKKPEHIEMYDDKGRVYKYIDNIAGFMQEMVRFMSIIHLNTKVIDVLKHILFVLKMLVIHESRLKIVM